VSSSIDDSKVPERITLIVVIAVVVVVVVVVVVAVVAVIALIAMSSLNLAVDTGVLLCYCSFAEGVYGPNESHRRCQAPDGVRYERAARQCCR
jgi:hypothetical protein